MGDFVGYARVSSIQQDLGVQLESLKDCDKIFKEKQSGTKDDRPELARCLEYLREGDTLVITKLDRLARSTLHLHKIVEDLQNRGIGFKVIDQQIDISSPQGKLFFGMLALFAEFENEIRKERQMAGIRRAQASGQRFGRGKMLTPEQVTEMKRRRWDGENAQALMNEYGIQKTTFYRLTAQEAS